MAKRKIKKTPEQMKKLRAKQCQMNDKAKNDTMLKRTKGATQCKEK